jgi:rhamnosyltransferase
MEFNRLGIFLYYDKEGIVDDYILYLLENYSKELTNLIIVCNGVALPDELDKLRKYSSKIMVRENKGFDAGGFKDAIMYCMQNGILNNIDEIVLFNDSFFGPIYPCKEMFSKMENMKVDFWSMTMDCGSIKRRKQIQSYFIVIRRRMIHSYAFSEYWTQLPYYDKFEDVVLKFEGEFAAYFEDKGFTWTSYINTEKYDTVENRKYAFSPYHNLQYELMIEQRYPILKKKLFSLDANSEEYGLNRKTQENFILALDYMKCCTSYDVQLIWNNILRIYNLRDIQDNCCLNYFLDSMTMKVQNKYLSKVLLVIIANKFVQNNPKVISRVMQYDAKVDFLFVVKNENNVIKSTTDNVKITIDNDTEQHGLFYYINKFKEKIQSYQIFGFLYLEDNISSECTPGTMWESVSWGDVENILGENEEYVDLIRETFGNNKKLGLLVSPYPVHGKFFYETGIDLKDNDLYDDLMDMAKKINIGKYINPNKRIANWSKSFWCRTSIVDELPMIEMNSTNQYQVEAMLLPYWCQSRRYYTGVIESTKYARLRETANNIMISGMVKILNNSLQFKTYVALNNTVNFLKKNIVAIDDYISKRNKVYIYGTGKIAGMIAECSMGYYGFVVSDGMNKEKTFHKKNVMYLSEISLDYDDGIILALNEENSTQVFPLLIERGYEHQILKLKY